jgi:hypothetical protein
VAAEEEGEEHQSLDIRPGLSDDVVGCVYRREAEGGDKGRAKPGIAKRSGWADGRTVGADVLRWGGQGLERERGGGGGDRLRGAFD